MTELPPSYHPDYVPPLTQQTLKPHRETTVLVLGILGFAVCFICGIIAWVMGKNDLEEMNAGIMDASGRSLTNAGRICGKISTILGIISLGIYSLWIIIVILSHI